MRTAIALAACTLALAVAVAVAPPAQAQAPAPGRVVGRVTDGQSGELPGVQIRLTADGVERSVIADAAGRFTFNELDADKSYSLRAELAGFEPAIREGLSIRPNETVTITLALRVDCAPVGEVDAARYSPFDSMLTADAVVHLRITEDGKERRVDNGNSCYIVSEAPAAILGVARLEHDDWRSQATLPLVSTDFVLRAGAEYLAFLHYNKSLQQISLGDAWVVVDGRVQRADQEELGFRDGSLIDQTLKRLRETYKRFSRYRRYDDIAPTVALETLRHKTGWLAIGALAADRDVWTDGLRDLRPDERPFEVVADQQPARNVPRAKDRIRLKEGGSIVILDFGSRGEALRNLSPTSRPRRWRVSDLTGTRADAGTIYTVADVQLEPGDDVRLVWVRLVAIR
jgi:hypothetical protein